MQTIVVTGAGGFIGWHLSRYLKERGERVIGVDIKLPEFAPSPCDKFLQLDLRRFENCLIALRYGDQVFHCAADMGGIGWISGHHAEITRNNSLIDINIGDAAIHMGVARLLYTSSACVYRKDLQQVATTRGLREGDAMPADPEEGYGWEKLYAEQLYTYLHEDYGLDVRLVRQHNVYGSNGTWTGGREKAPAALCRKVAASTNPGYLEVWGDGLQTRSFLYIDDCVEGLWRIMNSGWTKPVNLGTEELVTIDQLAETIMDVAGKRLTIVHDTTKPQGVRGRNSDNTLLREVTGWEPKTRLRDGIAKLYPWVHDQVRNA